MKRETVFAISLGILLGIGIGLFVLFKSNSGDQTKVIPVGDTDKQEVVTTANVSSDQTVLTISQPEEFTLVKNKDITIKGKTEPNSLIVVQSQVSSTVFKNKSADFSVDFPLALGENTISVSTYSNSNNPQEITLQVYYVTE